MDIFAAMKMVNENPNFLSDIKSGMEKWAGWQNYMAEKIGSVHEIVSATAVSVEIIRQSIDPNSVPLETRLELAAAAPDPRVQPAPLFAGEGDGVVPNNS